MTRPLGMAAKTFPRLTRARWLDGAFDVLARHGSAPLSLRCLADELRVTKGSFYWHFKDLADFQLALVEYWHDTHTLQVARAVGEVPGGPTEQLKHLMKIVILEGHARYDTVVTALGIQNPDLTPKIQATHEFRMRYVRSLLSAMGYRGKELSVRTGMFVGYMMSETQINSGRTDKYRVAQIPAMIAFLTEKS